jgi:hypothetical protein
VPEKKNNSLSRSGSAWNSGKNQKRRSDEVDYESYSANHTKAQENEFQVEHEFLPV